MATHWSILAWRTPWTEEPDGYCPWGCKELDMTEWLTHITRSYFFGQRQFIPFLLKDSREWALGGLWLSVLSRVLLFETPTDCSLPISSVPGILQARIQEQVAISFSRDLPDPGIKPTSPAWAGWFFNTETPGKPQVSKGEHPTLWVGTGLNHNF